MNHKINAPHTIDSPTYEAIRYTDPLQIRVMAASLIHDRRHYTGEIIAPPDYTTQTRHASGASTPKATVTPSLQTTDWISFTVNRIRYAATFNGKPSWPTDDSTTAPTWRISWQLHRANKDGRPDYGATDPAPGVTDTIYAIRDEILAWADANWETIRAEAYAYTVAECYATHVETHQAAQAWLLLSKELHTAAERL